MAKSKQLELFKAETTWFHVFKDMIDSGDVASMGPYAVTAYLVIKSYTNFATGVSFPSIETISEKSGMSERQTRRSLKVLEENGYLSKFKKGRKNIYTLREKVHMKDSKGRPAAVATWDYLPSTVEAARAELRQFKMTGENDGQIIHIENLTMNVQFIQGDHNDVDQINFDSIKDQKLKQTLENLYKKTKQ